MQIEPARDASRHNDRLGAGYEAGPATSRIPRGNASRGTRRRLSAMAGSAQLDMRPIAGYQGPIWEPEFVVTFNEVFTAAPVPRIGGLAARGSTRLYRGIQAWPEGREYIADASRSFDDDM